MSRRLYRQSGFTIIELLIATTVFSMILVVVTVGVMQFTKSYYRGVTASSTQNVARTTIDDIGQAMQFSGLDWRVLAPAGTGTAAKSQGYCVGSTRYSYLPGWQLKTARNDASFQNTHVFVRDIPSGGCYDNSSQTAQDLLSNFQGGTELLTTNMRISRFDMSPVGGDPNLYNLLVRVVYGDADLLVSPSQSAAVQQDKNQFNASATRNDVTCRSATAGTQFCAVSQLNTVIQRRVN